MQLHAVSQQVKRLEKQAGVPLLERVGRGVMLTSHGRHLADEDWIATPEGSICRQWLHRMFDGTGRLPRIAHVSLEYDSHMALVRAGLGIALVPRVGRAPLGDDLAAVPVTDPVPSREIIAVHRASMSDSPAVKALLSALANA